MGKGTGGAAGMDGFRQIVTARHAQHPGQQARDQPTKQAPRALFSGYPPSLVAVDWARSRHCSASFSIFEVSGGTVSPASREGTWGMVSPSTVTHVLTKNRKCESKARSLIFISEPWLKTGQAHVIDSHASH